MMRRLTISVDEDLADAFDVLVECKGYLNRSEAFRDLVRKELGQTGTVEMKKEKYTQIGQVHIHPQR